MAQFSLGRRGIDRIAKPPKHENLAAAITDVAIVQIQVHICSIAAG
jgi:hypothetical protein